jgi:hypothetical protein
MIARTITTAAALVALAIGSAWAQDTAPIYGSQLMTRQERIEYRNQMRALNTQEERNVFRAEHHRKMQERAQAKGLSLPEAPPAASGGMGPGGGGMGSRRGMAQ